MNDLHPRYHWALIIGPKTEREDGQGWRYHAKEAFRPDGSSGWLFEERNIPLLATQMLLVRVCVGKLEKTDRVKAILRSVPIRGDVPDWNCVYWVMDAFRLLAADNGAMGTNVLEWTPVRNAVMAFVQRKKEQHRFDGQGSVDTRRAPTYDLLERVETIP